MIPGVIAAGASPLTDGAASAYPSYVRDGGFRRDIPGSQTPTLVGDWDIHSGDWRRSSPDGTAPASQDADDTTISTILGKTRLDIWGMDNGNSKSYMKCLATGFIKQRVGLSDSDYSNDSSTATLNFYQMFSGQAVIEFYNINGSTLGTSTLALLTTSPYRWVRRELFADVPSGTAFMELRIGAQTNGLLDSVELNIQQAALDIVGVKKSRTYVVVR